MNMDCPKLLPCPFCQCDVIHSTKDHPELPVQYVQCMQCLVKIDGRTGLEEVIKLWNTRPAQPAGGVVDLRDLTPWYECPSCGRDGNSDTCPDCKCETEIFAWYRGEHRVNAQSLVNSIFGGKNNALENVIARSKAYVANKRDRAEYLQNEQDCIAIRQLFAPAPEAENAGVGLETSIGLFTVKNPEAIKFSFYGADATKAPVDQQRADVKNASDFLRDKIQETQNGENELAYFSIKVYQARALLSALSSVPAGVVEALDRRYRHFANTAAAAGYSFQDLFPEEYEALEKAYKAADIKIPENPLRTPSEIVSALEWIDSQPLPVEQQAMHDFIVNARLQARTALQALRGK